MAKANTNLNKLERAAANAAQLRGAASTKANTNLNKLERAVFDSVLASCEGNGYDFGFTDEVKVEGLSAQQIGAYLSSLGKKGLVDIDEPYYGTGERLIQIYLTAAGFELAGVEPTR
jgi:hypothetical protein